MKFEYIDDVKIVLPDNEELHTLESEIAASELDVLTDDRRAFPAVALAGVISAHWPLIEQATDRLRKVYEQI